MITSREQVEEALLDVCLEARDKALVKIGRHLDHARTEVARLERVLARCLDPKTTDTYGYRQERLECSVRFLDENHELIWEEVVRIEE